jgi:hypothetical protein
MNEEITGCWETDPEDINSLRLYGKVSIEFKSTGELIYIIQLKGKIQKMFMNYQINGKQLITFQTSSPRREETKFNILPNGKLELEFEGVRSLYIKINKFEL